MRNWLGKREWEPALLPPGGITALVNPLPQPPGMAEVGQIPVFATPCTCWEWAAVPSQRGQPSSSPSLASNVKLTHFTPVPKRGFLWPGWRMPAGCGSAQLLRTGKTPQRHAGWGKRCRAPQRAGGERGPAPGISGQRWPRGRRDLGQAGTAPAAVPPASGFGNWCSAGGTRFPGCCCWGKSPQLGSFRGSGHKQLFAVGLGLPWLCGGGQAGQGARGVPGASRWAPARALATASLSAEISNRHQRGARGGETKREVEALFT